MASTVLNISDDEQMEITPLGAGNEVGRSCILLKFKGKTIMFDCGVHPAYSGLASLPFFDEVDLSTVDLCLVSHFHLDHCCAVPYLTEKTNFKGRIFMTHPTKAVYKLLLSDFVRVTKDGGGQAARNNKGSATGGTLEDQQQLFDHGDLMRSMDRIEQIDYHQELEHNGIRFWCYNAGHVLGAAMFMVEIAGVRVLYTGDFSKQEDRHLMGAEVPPVQPDVLIVESTYGIQVHEPREHREKRFCDWVHQIVQRGGRCLLPVFALGRSQELLLILDEFWAAHPELHHIPIYYASSLAKKCMPVYQTYVNMMNDHIRGQIELSNPFEFRHISHLRSLDQFDDSGPCVVMASPGMLQSGTSRELFEMWCGDKRNGVIIPGYCVEGTLARYILSEPKDVVLSTGARRPLRMSVNYITFSAHSDFAQTSQFIEEVSPPNVVLVHGDVNNMKRLQSALMTNFKERGLQVHMPANTETLSLSFHGEKLARVVGSLARSMTQEAGKKIHPRPDGLPMVPTRGLKDRRLSGVLVTREFQTRLLHEDDLRSEFPELACSSVVQTLWVVVGGEWGEIEREMRRDYEGVVVVGEREMEERVSVPENAAVRRRRSGEGEEQVECMTICNRIRLTRTRFVPPSSTAPSLSLSPPAICVQWLSTPLCDIVADSVVLTLLRYECTRSESLAESLTESKTISNTESKTESKDESKTESKDESNGESNGESGGESGVESGVSEKSLSLSGSVSLSLSGAKISNGELEDLRIVQRMFASQYGAENVCMDGARRRLLVTVQDVVGVEICTSEWRVSLSLLGEVEKAGEREREREREKGVDEEFLRRVEERVQMTLRRVKWSLFPIPDLWCACDASV